MQPPLLYVKEVQMKMHTIDFGNKDEALVFFLNHM